MRSRSGGSEGWLCGHRRPAPLRLGLPEGVPPTGAMERPEGGDRLGFRPRPAHPPPTEHGDGMMRFLSLHKRKPHRGICPASLAKKAADAYRMARSLGWRIVISARSGETQEDWLAGLAVGWAGDYIKIGSIARSERLAKYNRLLSIENETRLPLAGGEAKK